MSMNISEREPLAYSVEDFCKLIGLGRSTVYNMIKAGEIKVARIGHRRLIPHRVAVALLEKAVANSKAA